MSMQTQLKKGRIDYCVPFVMIISQKLDILDIKLLLQSWQYIYIYIIQFLQNPLKQLFSNQDRQKLFNQDYVKYLNQRAFDYQKVLDQTVVDIKKQIDQLSQFLQNYINDILEFRQRMGSMETRLLEELKLAPIVASIKNQTQLDGNLLNQHLDESFEKLTQKISLNIQASFRNIQDQTKKCLLVSTSYPNTSQISRQIIKIIDFLNTYLFAEQSHENFQNSVSTQYYAPCENSVSTQHDAPCEHTVQWQLKLLVSAKSNIINNLLVFANSKIINNLKQQEWDFFYNNILERIANSKSALRRISEEECIGKFPPNLFDGKRQFSLIIFKSKANQVFVIFFPDTKLQTMSIQYYQINQTFIATLSDGLICSDYVKKSEREFFKLKDMNWISERELFKLKDIGWIFYYVLDFNSNELHFDKFRKSFTHFVLDGKQHEIQELEIYE